MFGWEGMRNGVYGAGLFGKSMHGGGRLDCEITTATLRIPK